MRRLTAAILLLAACAHAPPAEQAPMPRPSWPAPPAAPRARLLATLPAHDAPKPERPWWQILLGWITGGHFGLGDDLALIRPFGVAVAPDGSLLVADPDAGRLFRIDARGALSPVRCDGAELSSPMAVTASPDGAFLAADAGLGAIFRLRGDECRRLGNVEFERPTGIVSTAERIFVADPPRHQVVALGPDGNLVARWGAQGSGDGQFAFPTSVALAPDGTLLVTDALNFRVVRLGQDGRWLSAFGEPGDEAGQLSRPKGIAVDAEGRIYVSDAQRDLVLVFTAEGVLEYSIGGPGEAAGQLALPSGLATAGGRLYVADSQNRRIQVFELLGGTP